MGIFDFLKPKNRIDLSAPMLSRKCYKMKNGEELLVVYGLMHMTGIVHKHGEVVYGVPPLYREYLERQGISAKPIDTVLYQFKCLIEESVDIDDLKSKLANFSYKRGC